MGIAGESTGGILFGSPAISRRPVALRTGLTAGVPFSVDGGAVARGAMARLRVQLDGSLERQRKEP
jgi:hypothetical protein